MQVIITSTTGARRRAWLAILGSLALLAGILSAATPAEAAYRYKPPVEVFVANTTTTTAEITFRTVTGAPIYRVKAVSKGHTRTAYTGADGNWVITGLRPNTEYTFTVRCAMKSGSGYVLLSSESSGSRGKKKARTKNFAAAMQYPTTVVNGAPVDQALWLANKANPTKSQRYNGADLGVKAPAGFNSAVHNLRFFYARDQRMSTGRGYYTPALPAVSPAGVDTASTVEVPAPPSTAPAQPSTSAPAAPAASASTPPVASVDPSATGSAADASPASEPDPETPAATATAQAAIVAEPAEAVALASTSRVFASLPIVLPSPNANFYVRVQVVNKAGGAIVSDTSQALLVKTRSKFGFITGTVRDANGGALSKDVCRDYVVQAYGPSTFSGGTGKDLQQQVSLATTSTTCTGDFTLEVRPNAGYSVRAAYVGSSLAWQPSWYRAGSPGVAARSVGATEVTVAVGATTKLANDIRVRHGGTITGTAKCPTGSGTKPAGSCTVDVAAIVTGTGSYNNVITTDRSTPGGEFTLTGLPAGNYTIRVTRTDDSTFPHIAQALVAKVKYVEKSGVVVTAGATTKVAVP